MIRKSLNWLTAITFLGTTVACGPATEATDKDADKEKKETAQKENKEGSAVKVHSYSKPEEAQVTHLNLDIAVDFNSKTLTGSASYNFDRKEGATSIHFDTRTMEIEKVTAGPDEKEAKFTLGTKDEYLGQDLEITLDEGVDQVKIYYRTLPDSPALQWLNPQQTDGKAHPFLFTQSQAILARSWVPCQDRPGIRFTYDATVKVDKDLMAVMSAENPQQKNEEGVYQFRMQQPIPSYLLALSVGDLVFSPIGDRTGIYAEPGMIDRSTYEFAEMEDMLESAEELYGPYQWGRYDLIVLPPSFPFGGMENPRLTFATPTILAGDRSLTALVAHELAHSWSGNLVTNETWDDFWLNEGFTVYFERRIMESLYGADYANMLAILGHQELVEQVGSLKTEDTHLKLALDGRDPDDGMTHIAYEKGYFFLRMLEAAAGREAFDAFLKEYFTSHAFKTMDTERFVDYLNKNLIEPNSLAVDLDAWIYGPGVPADCPVVESDRFEKVEAAIAEWQGGKAAGSLTTSAWTTHEWLHFLRHLPTELSQEQLTELDDAFGFTKSGNSEILTAWFMHTIKHGYAAADPALEQFLISVGRRKFLQPLYQALVDADPTKEKARAIYEKARPNYHSVSSGTMDKMLDWNS